MRVVGQSGRVMDVLKKATQVAATDTTALADRRSRGTGKGRWRARLILISRVRAKGRSASVALNSGARCPDSCSSSPELFGLPSAARPLARSRPGLGQIAPSPPAACSSASSGQRRWSFRPAQARTPAGAPGTELAARRDAPAESQRPASRPRRTGICGRRCRARRVPGWISWFARLQVFDIRLTSLKAQSEIFRCLFIYLCRLVEHLSGVALPPSDLVFRFRGKLLLQHGLARPRSRAGRMRSSASAAILCEAAPSARSI